MRHILIVDDEENVALTLRYMLQKLPGCDIAVATGSQQALWFLKQRPFDLLITDHRMPGIDGMTLVAYVRQLYPRMAIIVITAYSSDALREQAAYFSIPHVLDKPLELAEIRRAALEALDRLGDSQAGAG